MRARSLPSGRIAVVGGGVAGCAAAIALRRAGAGEVVLLEASDAGRARVGETLPPDARRLLGLLGLGAAFDAEGHAPCHGSASSWGDDELGYNDHFVHPLSHGYHLDRLRFDAWMGRRAEEAGVERRLGARVTGAVRGEGQWSLAVGAGAGRGSAQALTADMVVDATGVPSAIGRRLGAPRLEHDRMTYLACSLDPAPGAPRSGQTWLEATRDGWWYAAQLPGGVWTLAVATDPEVMRAEELHTRAGFVRAFGETRHLHARLGHLTVREGKPDAWGITSSLLAPPAGPGWLAVGDAAAAYDPITARGIHKALEDALRAARAIAGALAGDPEAIAAFGRHGILAFRAYLEQRAFLYAREARFADAPFWRRRAARRNLTPGTESPSSNDT